jgi:AraC-like DNA-binding protein
MQHLLQALLLQIASCSKPPESVSIPKYQPIIRRFLADLESKFTKTRRVDDYVCKLGCSVKTLRRACIANRGIPPKTIIEQRVILEAKRLIAHTFIPIEQIGVTLGFDEPTNFAKFFHQHAQMTPTSRIYWS